MLTGSEKAVAAFVLSTIGGVVVVLLTQLPDNATVQLWGGIISGIVTVLATTLGVYKVTNKAKPAGG